LSGSTLRELEEYTKKIQIEGRVLGDIATNHVIPTAIRYQNTLIENVKLKTSLELEKSQRTNHFD
jgi:glutamine synthetase type III